MFQDKIDKAKKRHPRLRTCTCWDCLRQCGLTPPFELRHKFPRRYPHTVFNDKHPDIPRGDPNGKPTGFARAERKEKPETPAEATDKQHLRAAIRNREAI